VTLGHYKIIRCHGGSSTDMILEAFKRAYEDKADIITASLGLYSGWAEGLYLLVHHPLHSRPL
jgi:hypothetical protein